MVKIRDALAYFQMNKPDRQEYINLKLLYKTGWSKLLKYSEQLLQENFSEQDLNKALQFSFSDKDPDSYSLLEDNAHSEVAESTLSNEIIGTIVTKYKAQVAEPEQLEVDPDLCSAILVALTHLIKHERTILDILDLKQLQDKQDLILQAILDPCIAAVMREVSDVTRCGRRQDLNTILPFLQVLKTFSEIGIDLQSELNQLQPFDGTVNSVLNSLVNRTRKTLNDLISSLNSSDPGSIFSSSQVPQDANVHQVTANTMNFLEELANYASIVGYLLTAGNYTIPIPKTDKMIKPTHLYQLAYATGPNADSKSRAVFVKKLGEYIHEIIFTLLENINRKSESYTKHSELMALLFQMNNIQYIMKSTKNDVLIRYLKASGDDYQESFQKLINERRQIYQNNLHLPGMLNLENFLNSTVNQPVQCGSSTDLLKRRQTEFSLPIAPSQKKFSAASLLKGAITPTLRRASCITPQLDSAHGPVKFQLESTCTGSQLSLASSIDTSDLLKNFNSGVWELIQLHKQVTIPDTDLQEVLRRALVNSLVPVYNNFFERCKSIAFTSNRGKYVRYTPQEFEIQLNQMLNSGGSEFNRKSDEQLKRPSRGLKSSVSNTSLSTTHNSQTRRL
ncbi:hypothetical protein Ciccas_003143 [Cichlidogyrus casuarinus]|uniref:Exocyst complex component 7 n=1 Tax=Cichlidogyrus casuarinus TaxID=1844966 RepID=A0ABD2QF76_9PLAT